MLAIDTNVVVRTWSAITGAAQRALDIIEKNDVFAPVTVISEAEWVLRDAYELPREQVIGELRRFADLPR